MNSTKGRVAQAFKEIVCRKSFQKITISDIARECDMTRENFYYHFHDKFDIIRWILEKEIVNSLPQTDNFLLWMKAMINICEKEKIFYIRIIHEIGKESIQENLLPIIKNKLIEVIEVSLNDSVWNKRKEKIDFVADFYGKAFVDLLCDSVLNKEIISADQLDSNLEFLASNYMPFVRIEKESMK